MRLALGPNDGLEPHWRSDDKVAVIEIAKKLHALLFLMDGNTHSEEIVFILHFTQLLFVDHAVALVSAHQHFDNCAGVPEERAQDDSLGISEPFRDVGFCLAFVFMGQDMLNHNLSELLDG